MCMIDMSDGFVEIINDSMPKARKSHKCLECARAIKPGEKYKYEAGVYDGEFNTYKTCSNCLVARDWLLKECHGYLYGSVEEDLSDHWCEWRKEGFMELGRLIVGMRRQWEPFNIRRISAA